MTALHRVAVCLLTLLSIQRAHAQIQSPADSIIQMWRWESEDGYSTVDISAPHLVLFEGNAYEFELYNGAFYFLTGKTSIPYRYDEVRSRLTLIFPEGPPLEYHPVISSVYLRRITNQKIYNGRALYGRFCHREYHFPVSGTREYRTRAIAFWASGEFDFSAGAVYASIGTGESSALGTAVLCGNAVILSFYSGQAAEAQVVECNSFGEVTRVKYAGEEYALNECEIVESSPPPPPPPPPPPRPGPDPDPGPQPDPTPPQPSPDYPRPTGPTRDPVRPTSTSPSTVTERPVSHRPTGNIQDSGTNGSSAGTGGNTNGGSTNEASGGRPGGHRR